LRPIYTSKSSPDELNSIHEVFDDLVYKPIWFNFESKKIKKIIDVGSQIGSFALWANEQWPQAVIHCYEPDPNSFKILKKNILAAKSKKISAFNFAIWDKKKQLKFFRFKNNSGSNSIVYSKNHIGKHDEIVNVKSNSIRKAIDKIGTSVDILKLDCEGAEYNILYSLEKNDLKKIKFLVIEYHEFDNDSQHRGNHLSNYLRSQGFTTQLLPQDIREGQGIGYIYASSLNIYKKFIKIFDEETSLLINQLKIVNEREEYALSLESSLKNKNTQIQNLDSSLKNKNTQIQNLDSSLKNKNTQIQNLDNLVKQQDSNLSNSQKLLLKWETHVDELKEIIRQKNSKLVEVKKLANELETLASEREEFAKDLENTLIKKYNEISKLNQALENKTNEIIPLRNQLNEIQNSRIFKIMKKISKNIDSSFPNYTKRGEFKKIVAASLETVDKEGYKNYLSEVKTKLNRREFKILTPFSFTDEEENSLLKEVYNNRKKRLKIKQHDKNEIKNDEFIIEGNLK